MEKRSAAGHASAEFEAYSHCLFPPSGGCLKRNGAARPQSFRKAIAVFCLQYGAQLQAAGFAPGREGEGLTGRRSPVCFHCKTYHCIASYAAKNFFENWQVNFFQKKSPFKKVFSDIFNGAGMDWDAAKEIKKSGAFPHRSRRALLLRAKFHFPKPLSVSLSMPDPF